MKKTVLKKNQKMKIISADDIWALYEKAKQDLKEKQHNDMRALIQTITNDTLLIVESMYQDFTWRGDVSYTELKRVGSCLFNGLEQCTTIHLTNEGFEFSGNKGSKRIPLKQLHVVNMPLLVALIKFMQNK